MFYVFSESGITVTEQGRKTIFVPKDHEDYEEIKAKIDKMSYDNILSFIDTKTHLQMLLSEDVEGFFNEDGDFQLDIKELKDQYKKDLKALATTSIMESVETLDDKQKQKISTLLERLDVTKIRLVFE